MRRKAVIAIVAVLGIACLGLITYTFFASNGEGVSELQRLLFIEGSSQFLSADDPYKAEEAPKLGYLAPAIKLTALDGKAYSLQDFSGKPTLLNFWATWCPSCRAEMSALQAFYEQHQGRIQVVGINWGERSSSIGTFLEGLKITFPTLLDERGTAFVSYQLTGVPTSMFLDAAGVIRGIWLGPMTLAELQAGFARFVEGV